MKYFVKAASDKEYEIDLKENADGSFDLHYENENIHVNLEELKQGQSYSILLDQQSHDVILQRMAESLELTMEGRPYQFKIQNKMAKALEKAGGVKRQKRAEPIIKAEMPGVVIELKVKVGDRVEQGDVLLILEAMKMQNEILATAPGQITHIKIKTGAQVGDGDELIRLKYIL